MGSGLRKTLRNRNCVLLSPRQLLSRLSFPGVNTRKESWSVTGITSQYLRSEGKPVAHDVWGTMQKSPCGLDQGDPEC